MLVKVEKHKCIIEKTPVNEQEVNITKVQFEFDEDMQDMVKEAYFTYKNNSYKVIIQNNECNIPNEVLTEKGQVELGVVCFEVQNDELIKRYNPSPAYFDSWTGSLREAENTEPITPTDKEQIESAITDLQNTKQDTLVSGENIKTINNESLLGSGNLEVITDLSDYYTKEQTDDLLDNKVDNSTLNNYYQKNETYNKNEIDSIKTTIEGEIPTSTSDLENDSGFITKSVNDLENYSKTTEMNSAISNAVSTETTNRQNSDTNLQNQIDAITSASDVVDVVSTYQELQNYDTSKLTNKDVIKVMQDSTHNNALSYYRWNTTSFVYVGSEGPFYTKGETDTLLNQKANTSDIPDLTNYVKNTDYATTSKAGVIKPYNDYGTSVGSSNGILYANVVSYAGYQSGSNNSFIGKGTLENVITGKELVNQTTLNESQEEQNETINELETKLQETQAELERYKLIENALPKVSGTGTSITLDNTANAGMTLELNPSELEQETTTGKNLLNIPDGTYTDKGITSVAKDGEITLNGTATDNAFVYIRNVNISVLNNNYYTWSANNPATTSNIIVRFDSNIMPETLSNVNQTKTTLFTSDQTLTNFLIRVTSGTTLTNFKIKPQLEKGSTATSYEPYTEEIPAPNPNFPMPIHTISGDNSIKVYGRNLAYTGWVEDFVSRINNVQTARIETKDNRNCLVYNANAGYQDYDNKYIFKTNWKENTQYTISCDINSGSNYGNICIEYTDGALEKPSSFTSNSWEHIKITSTSNKTIKYIRVYYGSGFTYIDLDTFMVYEGTEELDYEPYQEQIVQLNLPVENLFDKNGTFTDGFLSYLGVIQVSANYKITDFMSIQPNTSYITSGGNLGTNPSRCYYDKDKNFISGIVHNGVTEFVDVSPNNAYYMKESIPIVALDTIQIEKGTKANSYTPFGETPIEYSAIGNYKDQFYKATSSNNLFDKDNANVLKLVPSGGSNMKYINSDTNASIYIPIIGGKTYTISRQVLSNRFSVATSSEVPVSNGTIIDITTNNSATSLTLTTSSNANYLCVYLTNDGTNFDNTLDTLMINEGTTALPYEPYNNGAWYLKKNIGKTLVTIGSVVTYQEKNAGVYAFSGKINSANSGGYCSKAKWVNRSLVNANTNECYDNASNVVFVGTSTDTLVSLKEKFDGSDLYYVLATPTYTLLNDTLQEELNIIEELLSYQGQTNITQQNDDLPFDMVATTLKDLSSL